MDPHMIRSITGALARKRSELGQKEKGFTLIELLVVVIIIGILAAVAIPIFLGQQTQAKISAVEADLTNAKTAIVAQMVTSTTYVPATGAIAAATLPGFSPSTDVTLNVATASATAFCIDGGHAGATAAADKRHVRDTGGVKRGTCASPIA